MRPFSLSASVICRGYSLPLQRRMTDFGADQSFAKAVGKMKEHYGIEVPISAIQSTTEKHAENIRKRERLQTEIPKKNGMKILIAETDGAYIPIVETFDVIDEEGNCVDKRKTRTVGWKDSKLALAYPEKSLVPIFSATMGGPDEAGDHLLHCANQAGLGANSKVHCVGDGAPWIASQVNRVFGSQGNYLIDFYHLCDYLGAASETCNPKNPEKWFKHQKELMRSGQIEEVLEKLEPHIEPESVLDQNAPVRKCHRYIINRPGQFEYNHAIENSLPIGSGKIESGHRYVVQDRLKIAGAWWEKSTADNMLALRTLRVNSGWDDYWADDYWIDRLHGQSK